MSNYAIYQPKNKAAEYSAWACNFYVGCSNGCTYCYCKKGILAGVMGQDKPQLKKCFKNETHAITTFLKELTDNICDLQKHGLFFSFTTDPMLPETIGLTQQAIRLCLMQSVPVKVLTKCTEWVNPMLHELVENDTIWNLDWSCKNLFAVGFTLTGHDELEPGASTNAERIEAMKKLHDAGFITFASIEPVIDLTASMDMIDKSVSFCDLYKIGLMSGQKIDKLFKASLNKFITAVCNRSVIWDFKIYFKDSLLKAAGINRSELPANCVTRDFNLFKSE